MIIVYDSVKHRRYFSMCDYHCCLRRAIIFIIVANIANVIVSSLYRRLFGVFLFFILFFFNACDRHSGMNRDTPADEVPVTLIHKASAGVAGKLL